MALEDLLFIVPKPIRDKILKKNKSENDSTENSGKKKKEEESIEDILPFEDIYENILKIEGGKYRLYARTNAISLSDMGQEDKETIIELYVEFINAHIKPYQMYIPSYVLDIKEEIELLEEKKLEKEEETDIAWLDDDIQFQQELIEENDIIDTQFYFIFETNFKSTGNEGKDFLKAKKDLSKQFKYASDELEAIGLNLLMLDREQIGKLLHNFFNPFNVGIQEPDFSDSIVVGMVEDAKDTKDKKKKKIFRNNNVENEEELFFLDSNKETDYLERGGLSFKEKIAPYSINDRESADYIKLGSTYISVYEVYDYPTNVPQFWAKKLYKFKNNIDISFHIDPIKTSEITRELEKANKTFGSATIDLKSGGKRKARTMIDKKMEKTEQQIDLIMDKLDDSDQNFYHFSMYVSCKARSREQLEDLEMELENVLGGMKVLFRKTSENMRNALLTIAPFGINKLGTTRNMLTDGVANAFPFTNHTFSHKHGIFLGTHKYNSSFVRFDPLQLENANGAVLGTSGGGKSVTTKKIVKGLATIKDAYLWIIDPEGETLKGQGEKVFAKEINAAVLNYYAGSNHKINILEPTPDDEIESLIKPQINFVKIVLARALELTREDLSKVDYYLINLYNKFGFTDDKDTYYDDKRSEEGKFFMERPRRIPPELYHLYKDLDNEELKEIVGETKHIANLLREWTREGSNDLFDGQTNVDFTSKRIIFNLKHLDKYTKDIGVFVLMHTLWGLARKYQDIFKVIYAEELHHMMRNDDMGEYMFDLNKRIRKYKGMTISVTQNVTDFMKTKWGAEILKNCSWSILMKQKKQDVDILQDIFQMFRTEALRMTRFNHKKGECYLIADGFKIPLNIRVSEKELETFRTS